MTLDNYAALSVIKKSLSYVLFYNAVLFDHTIIIIFNYVMIPQFLSSIRTV